MDKLEFASMRILALFKFRGQNSGGQTISFNVDSMLYVFDTDSLKKLLLDNIDSLQYCRWTNYA